MGSRETKLEELLPKDGLAVFFGELAARLTGPSGENAEKAAGDLAGFSKVKIELKREGDKVEIKLKVRWDESKAEQAGETDSRATGSRKVKYKTLKKRMEKTFGAISEDLKKDLMPSEETVGDFLRDARQMVTYPGKGDLYYDDFTKACAAFREAFQKGDVAMVRAEFETLDRLKDESHDRFK